MCECENDEDEFYAWLCRYVLILNPFMQCILCLYTFDTVHSDCIGSFSA